MPLIRANHSYRYAVRTLAYLVAQGDTRVAGSRSIGLALGIPEDFLLKVLRRLAAVGILRGVRGCMGGFRVAKRPAELSLRKIVGAMEGPLPPESSHTRSERSRLDERLWLAFEDAAEAARQQLREVGLAELIR